MMEDNDRDSLIQQVAQDLEDKFVQDAEQRALDTIAKLEIETLNKTVNSGTLSIASQVEVGAMTGNAIAGGSAQVAQQNNSLYTTNKTSGPYAFGWSDPRVTLSIQQSKPNYNICFHQTVDDGKGGKHNVQIGKLDFNGGAVKFEGNFEESAVRFVEYLSTQFSRRLRDEHIAAAKLLAELVTFELADEVEIDDAYRKGFNDAMQACRAMFHKQIDDKERGL